MSLFVWRRVSLEVALTWANGLFTDYALQVLEQQDGPALFVQEIEGRGAWRQLARHLQAQPAQIMVFRAMDPAVQRHAERWQAQLTHRDEFGPRYLVNPETLQRFAAHFAHEPIHIHLEAAPS